MERTGGITRPTGDITHRVCRAGNKISGRSRSMSMTSSPDNCQYYDLFSALVNICVACKRYVQLSLIC